MQGHLIRIILLLAIAKNYCQTTNKQCHHAIAIATVIQSYSWLNIASNHHNNN